MATSSQKKIFSEINITPLTDIFLVLLIIMMVVAPILTNSRRDIKTPTISAGNAVDQEWPVLEISSEGRYYLRGREVYAPDLQETLTLQRPGSTPKNDTLLLRAHKTVKSELVLKVLRAAEAAQFARVVVAGESKPAAESQEASKP